MDAGLAIIAGAAGLIGYKVLSSKTDTAQQPGPDSKQPFWNSWFNSGSQPQTGNGQPNTDQTGKDIANTVQAVSKFSTSLLDFFGTSHDSNSSGGGSGPGTKQTAQYSDGRDFAMGTGMYNYDPSAASTAAPDYLLVH